MKIQFFTHCIVLIALGIGGIGLVYAYDAPLESDEIKSILLKKLVPDIDSDTIPELFGESSIRFALIDTPIMAISSWKFSYDPKRIWKVKKLEIKRISIYSADNGKWFPTTIDDVISQATFDSISRLLLYPFSIVAKRFRGYSFKAQKKRVEVDGNDCIKISVRPLKEDNDEESPFYGYIYITDDDNSRPIRFEHRKESTTGTIIVRWEFKNIDKLNCVFPYKFKITTQNKLCNFKLISQIKIFFGDFEVRGKSNSQENNVNENKGSIK